MKNQPCERLGCNETHIYHMTKIENLASIVTQGALYSHSAMQSRKMGYTDIANQDTQTKRGSRPVPLPPKGTIHNYVPFYFAPHSPMLYYIINGKNIGYQNRQDQIIHLVTTVPDVARSGLSYVFTDKHPISTDVQFYNNLEDLSNIDWDVMRYTYWDNRPGDKLKRQAEFLVYFRLPWSLIREIGVANQEVANRVQQIIGTKGQRVKVSVEPTWYY